MEEKQARLTVLIDPHHKAAFDAICSSREESSSEVLRQLITDYLVRHGVRLQPDRDGSAAAAG
jgi:predicted transcriptional regulator